MLASTRLMEACKQPLQAFNTYLHVQHRDACRLQVRASRSQCMHACNDCMHERMHALQRTHDAHLACETKLTVGPFASLVPHAQQAKRSCCVSRSVQALFTMFEPPLQTFIAF